MQAILERAEGPAAPDARAQAIREALSRIPTTAALDLLKARNPASLVMHGVKPLFPGQAPVAGRARTLRFLPVRGDHPVGANGPANFDLLDSTRPGDFLVFDTQGWDKGSVLGDMLALRAQTRGAVGVATDGAMRDLAGHAEVGLPVFARAVYPVPSAATLAAWDADIPVQCGGALVLPGDWVLADADAVIVIPHAWVMEVIDGFEAFSDEEAFCRALLQRGLPLKEAYPMPRRLHPLLERYRADKHLPTRAEVRQALGLD